MRRHLGIEMARKEVLPVLRMVGVPGWVLRGEALGRKGELELAEQASLVVSQEQGVRLDGKQVEHRVSRGVGMMGIGRIEKREGRLLLGG